MVWVVSRDATNQMEVRLINHTPGTKDALLQHEMCKYVELLTRTGGLGSPSPSKGSSFAKSNN